MNVFLAAPEIALLTAACAILLIDVFLTDAQRHITYGLTLLTLAVTALLNVGLLTGDLTGVAFGGMYLADPLAALLKIFTCLTVGLTLVYARPYARDRGLWQGELFTLALFATLGICVMISAGNLLTVYLGLELQSLALYALVALRRDDARATEAAMKYFVLGALASGFLLYGMSMLYGATGTLDLNTLAAATARGATDNRAALVLGAVFVVAGIAFKLGAVPFHMWVPDVYQGAPTPVTLLIGSASKLAAFAIAFRLLVDGLLPLAADWQHMLVVLSVASLLVGNLAAVAQSNLKRMLAYSTIGQIGFMLLATAAGVLPAPHAGNLLALANAWSAALFYVLSYALTALVAFGLILLLARQGFEAEEIADFAGLNQRNPWYAGLMALAMFSLAGIPPTVGFTAKLVVLQAVLGAGMIWLAVVAVLLSLVAAFYYLRVVKVMYFDAPPDALPDVQAITAGTDARLTLSANGAALLLLGVFPQGLLALCTRVTIRALGG
jgi:NADH-quinone oxidoreductase subunit N